MYLLLELSYMNCHCHIIHMYLSHIAGILLERTLFLDTLLWILLTAVASATVQNILILNVRVYCISQLMLWCTVSITAIYTFWTNTRFIIKCCIKESLLGIHCFKRIIRKISDTIRGVRLTVLQLVCQDWTKR